MSSPYRVADDAHELPEIGWEEKLERMKAKVEPSIFQKTKWRAWIHTMDRDGATAMTYGHGDHPSAAVENLWTCYQRMLSEGWERS